MVCREEEERGTVTQSSQRSGHRGNKGLQEKLTAEDAEIRREDWKKERITTEGAAGPQRER